MSKPSVFVVGGFDIREEARREFERIKGETLATMAQALIGEHLGLTPPRPSIAVAADLTHLMKTWELMLAYGEDQD